MKRSEWIELCAGAVQMYYAGGELRYLRVNDQEVVRRIYVAVRDQWWRTVPVEISNLQTQIENDHFALTFTATHQDDEVDFVWQGTITGNADSTISFTMDGEAQETFQRNRIGICVLHPPHECAGRPCWVERTDGAVETGAFPEHIAPHQPFKDMRAITHEVAPGLKAEVRFAGDIFEMEDQRNWTDNSFKIYSTPLALPFPVEVPQGTKINQSVTVSLQGSKPAFVRPAVTEPITLRLGAAAIGKLPRIGLGVASHGQDLTAREIERLRQLHLSHLRVDLRLQGSDYEGALQRATNEARALDVKLEIALFLSDAAETELRALASAVERLQPPVLRWLIFHEAEKVTATNWVRLARTVLQAYDSTAHFGAGTDHYFTELNRQRPTPELAEMICYTINPQVHAKDDVSLAETLEIQAATLKNARHFLGDKPLVVSPVTLKPRYNPHTANQSLLQRSDRLPDEVDARQMSLFGAAWTLGSLKYLAEGGAASVTYYETTGWRGVMENEAGSPMPELFPSAPGMVFPLYHVLADIGEFSEAEVIPVSSSNSLAVIGLALRRDKQMRLLLANVSGLPQKAALRTMTEPVQVRRLTHSDLASAMHEPDAFRQGAYEQLSPQQDELIITLRPDETVRLDFA
jgi:D-apionolactonase